MTMGKGGSRPGAGRPATRPLVERLFRLDAREMHRLRVFEELEDGFAQEGVVYRGGRPCFNYHFDGSSIRIELAGQGQGRIQTLGVEHTPCRFGGSRPWLLCPKCGGRVLVLYWQVGQVACHGCTGASYRTQRLDLVSRTWVKQRKIERRLGADHTRAKRMHWATYWRLMDQIGICQNNRVVDLLAWGRKAFPHLWR